MKITQITVEEIETPCGDPKCGWRHFSPSDSVKVLLEMTTDELSAFIEGRFTPADLLLTKVQKTVRTAGQKATAG